MAQNRSQKRDFYDILGVGKTASQDDIKRAFRSLAKQKHPDVTKNPADAEEFKKISEAYEVLSNPEKRKMYDNFGHDGVNAGGPGAGFGQQGFGDFGDIFSDLFGDFFGGRQGHSQSRGQQNVAGPNYQKVINISLADVILAKKQALNINVEVACDACNQTGARTPKDYVQCQNCQGHGYRTMTSSTMFGQRIQQQVLCNHCQGVGKIVTQKCLKCKGHRFFVENQKLEFNLPYGIGQGDSLRIRGKGGFPRHGRGSQGDLIIKVLIQDDRHFKRKGHDIYVDVPVSYLDVLLGNIIQIPTIDHKFLKKELKLGMQDGDQLIIGGEGSFINASRRGNLIAVLKVKMPNKIPKEVKEKLWSINQDFPADANESFIKEFNKRK